MESSVKESFDKALKKGEKGNIKSIKLKVKYEGKRHKALEKAKGKKTFTGMHEK